MNVKRISKFLSLVLRHRPELIGIELDLNGWVQTDVLLEALKKHQKGVDFDTLCYVVETNNKKRFAFNGDKSKIRASQGHSVKIELNLKSKRPPKNLFHGTVSKFLDSIKQQGLIRGSRNHVHLSTDHETAQTVGSRRGKPVVLTVNSAEMHTEGYLFYLSDNGIWLTDHVPSRFIDFS